MSALAIRPNGLTANQRLKEGFEARLALSLVAATVLHLLVFTLWPTMEATAWGGPNAGAVDVIDIPTVDIPPAPQPLARPALPVATPDVTATTTMPDVGWEEARELPPPPPVPTTGAVNDAPRFTPYTVGPALLNEAEVARALEREYPSMLRDAGITGTVALLVHIDAAGKVLETRVEATSGVTGLDEAALRVADVFRFRAALNRDTPVAVWIRLPVAFRVR